MRFRLLPAIAIFLSVAVVLPQAASARIKLITLPVRQRVEIQLDHANATLVEEERIVPLVAGVNQVDFSWANTQIDPGTIIFRVMLRAEEENAASDAAAPLDAKVLSVSYPPGENALVWQVSADRGGSARVRISYLLGNLSKSFNYRAVAAHDESTLLLSQYIRLENFANEEFLASGLWAGFGPRFLKPVGINETKQMLMEKFAALPIRKTYTVDAQQYGYIDRPKNKLLVPMHYVLKNDKKNNLGQAPLQFGKVRIFQEDGRGSTAFLGEDWGQFTPLDDEMKLYVGTAQDIVVVRTIERNEQKRIAGNLFRREVVLKYEIENFKDKPAVLDLCENLRAVRRELGFDTDRDPQWELGPQTTFAGGLDKEKTTFEQAVLHADLPARSGEGKAEKIVQKLHLVINNEW